MLFGGLDSSSGAPDSSVLSRDLACVQLVLLALHDALDGLRVLVDLERQFRQYNLNVK